MDRTKRGRELAERINQQTILERMPKIYFVFDEYRNACLVGRTDWPGDRFNIIRTVEFATFCRIYEGLGFTILDETYGKE